MKKVQPIKQHDATDCAVACIASVARYWGLALPLASIRQACGASAQGTTIKGITDACESINLAATPCKSSTKDLDSIDPDRLPAILHTATEEGDPHFVVLCSYDDQTAEIMDPAEGKILRLVRDRLRSLWSGYLVLVSPTEDFRPGDKTLPLKTRLGQIFSLCGSQIVASTLLALCYILIGISFSVFLQYFIDKVIPTGDSYRIIGPALIMTALSILALIIGNLRTNTLLSAATGIDIKIINTYISHLFRLPVAFFNIRGAGEINSRIGDAYTIRRFVTEGIPSIVISVFTLATAFVLMFSFQWKLALLTAAFVPVYTVIFCLASKAAGKFNKEIVAGSTAFEKKCVEGISAVRSVKYATAEREASRNITAQYMSLCDKMFRGGRAAGRYSYTAETASRMLTVVLLSAGSLVILSGQMSVGTLVGFYAITSFFSAPLAQLVSSSNLISQTKIASERLFEVMDLEEEPREGCDVPDGQHDLVFDGISFCYPGSLNLLENFSAVIPAGKITAIKGRSGCGKSSLAALAMRLYAPTKGRISFGGCDIGMFDLRQWRRKVTIVPQDVRLLDDTILYNISGSKRDYDLERIAYLLVELGLDGLIKELPNGLMTMVGESGCRLSGGQKQRIAIAAALYRQPDILILDEATNSLDAASQQLMMQAIGRLNKERNTTIIMITHKADEVPIADNLIQM